MLSAECHPSLPSRPVASPAFVVYYAWALDIEIPGVSALENVLWKTAQEIDILDNNNNSIIDDVGAIPIDIILLHIHIRWALGTSRPVTSCPIAFGLLI